MTKWRMLLHEIFFPKPTKVNWAEVAKWLSLAAFVAEEIHHREARP